MQVSESSVSNENSEFAVFSKPALIPDCFGFSDRGMVKKSMARSFALNVLDECVATALPPDVRRWLCPAGDMPFTFLGCALGSAFGTINPQAKPEPGA